LSAYELDVAALHRLLDEQRRERHLSWRAVARECGIPQSSPTRIARGMKPEADNLVSLLAWAGIDVRAVTIAGTAPARCDRCRSCPPAGYACLACGAEGPR
jgi:hypothetical protein